MKSEYQDSLSFEPMIQVLDVSGFTPEAVFSPEKWEEMRAKGMFNSTPFENAIEYAGRECYNSFDKGRPTEAFHQNIIDSRHSSVTEHTKITFRLSGVSRNLTHELVRQRVGVAYSQLSSRYVDYSKFKVVAPPELQDDDCFDLALAVGAARRAYRDLYNKTFERVDGTATEKRKRARGVARVYLPGSAETSIVVTYNLGSFLHFLALRGSRAADIEMPRLAVMMLNAVKQHSPNYLGKIKIVPADDNYCVESLDVDTIPFNGAIYHKGA